MGKRKGWARPSSSGLLVPNGLLPGEAALIAQVLDSERWLKAEERTAELIPFIQPNKASEERRNAVTNYVRRLIMKCFPCQVFTFGSTPFKTYLPDADIDLTAVRENQNLKDTWADQVQDMLESEKKNENAEFCVKDVQCIRAKVKIVKCLVENTVVDISLNKIDGLCTLCFLEVVDNKIMQNHLFKRSIILVKAWCYYESRILGAQHGLISTYALETLVLYIFHVFNKSFAGPLEVLYRFLELFSKFDWDKFCVSLRGPVPISSLPDVTAMPPWREGGDLLLDEQFLNDWSSGYAILPGGQENQGKPFIPKNFNVIDPLCENNNLGRSVRRCNFFRIRSAFAYGAKRLTRLLHCPKENILHEINDFFTNTWDRYGNGHHSDAPENELWRLRLPITKQVYGSGNARSSPSSKKDEIFSSNEAKIDFGLQNVSSPVTFTMHGKNKSSSHQSSTQADNDSRDWNTLSTSGPEAAERSLGPQSVSSLPVPMHLMPGFESARISRSDSMMPFPQVILGPNSRQRPMDSSEVVFYPRCPPVPIVAFSVPIHNDSGSSASSSHFGGEERSTTSDSGASFEILNRSNPSKAINNTMGQVASVEPIEPKSDVLNSDFMSHWHNFQYRRSCQNSHNPGPVIYPSPGVLPSVDVQGYIPWDGTGRLVSNVSLISQLCGPRQVPIPQLQPVCNGPTSVYHVDGMPRYQTGTGTYLPNPKVSSRERHSSTRQGNYSYDRRNHHGDRDGHWSVNSKSRASGRSHSSNQAEKLVSRSDQVTAGDTQVERTWSPYRHGSLSSYNSQTSTIHSNTTPASPANMAYSMYHLPAVNPSMASPSGPALPSIGMLYPYDHNGAYGIPSEQLEFGSLGAVGLSGLNDVSQLSDGNCLNGALEEQKFPVSQNSPEQPSSPHLRR